MALLAITELPWAVDVNLNFVLGDRTKRSAWQNSFFMLSDQHVGYALTVSPGAVAGSHGTVTLTPLAGAQYSPSATGFLQVYVGDREPGPFRTVCLSTQ